MNQYSFVKQKAMEDSKKLDEEEAHEGFFVDDVMKRNNKKWSVLRDFDDDNESPEALGVLMRKLQGIGSRPSTAGSVQSTTSSILTQEAMGNNMHGMHIGHRGGDMRGLHTLYNAKNAQMDVVNARTGGGDGGNVGNGYGYGYSDRDRPNSTNSRRSNNSASKLQMNAHSVLGAGGIGDDYEYF